MFYISISGRKMGVRLGPLQAGGHGLNLEKGILAMQGETCRSLMFLRAWLA